MLSLEKLKDKINKCDAFVCCGNEEEYWVAQRYKVLFEDQHEKRIKQLLKQAAESIGSKK